VLCAIGLRRMQRNSARFAATGRPPVRPAPAAIARPLRTPAPPSPTWSATDWSLPRDVDPPDDPTSLPPTDPAPADPPAGESQPPDDAAPSPPPDR